MKRISLVLDDTTYDLVRQQSISALSKSGNQWTESRVSRKATQIMVETIMAAFFSSDVCLCDRCGKGFSLEADEGSVREEGAFCNRHLPKETEEV